VVQNLKIAESKRIHFLEAFRWTPNQLLKRLVVQNLKILFIFSKLFN